YSLSSQEGILLMRLAESLVRTPDPATASYLLRDKINAGTWRPHLRASHGFVKLGTLGLSACKAWIQTTGGVEGRSLLARLGDRVMLSAVRQAIGLLGRHFVVGTAIETATKRARTLSDYDATYSYDMLGEAALTDADAARYFDAYKSALLHLASTSEPHQPLQDSPALSVKLSALHPRYEFAQKDRCVPALAERMIELCEIASKANIGLTIDAEEADRLEVSLLVFERLLAASPDATWAGLGLAVQAYQRRALAALTWISEAAQTHRRRISVRLVKGAYWDSEIKRAQALGLADYPVFTRKEHTDISYLAAARFLLERSDHIYPQFATHNAHTAATIAHMAEDHEAIEFQRLHGMSDGLHRRLAQESGFAIRTYAPVGRHKDLLPYLVRRLLENGANASFVNQLMETDVTLEDLISNPVETARQHGFSPHPHLPAPRHRADQDRRVALGHDLTQPDHVRRLGQVKGPSVEEAIDSSDPDDVEHAIQRALQSTWSERSASDRAQILRHAADLLDRDRLNLMTICVFEAGKTWPDAEAELREAIDFLTYYAEQAERPDIAVRRALGPIACISPWNFPLAIFLGQVSAALSVGNTVIAKPAEQTPQIATAAVVRLIEAGVPEDAVQLIFGGGEIGAALVSNSSIQGICFTGSTATAKHVANALSETGRAECPLIAETGGINAMIVDSTSLLEQAVQDVVRSAFQSAGQRCSACRIVCVQSDSADQFIELLSGAMQTLRIGDPAEISTDIGPIIDAEAYHRIAAYIGAMRQTHSVIGEAPRAKAKDQTLLAPIAFEVAAVSDVKKEVFGPVLHLVRFDAPQLNELLEDINQLGFGLTMGLHTRIDARIAQTTARAKVGNLYINRDQIGAIVGEQPFGGEGLSGTGPKAGGPDYLLRLTETNSGPRITPTAPLTLPGPTGETNTLSYVPRGNLLCLGGDDPSDLEGQIARVKATGNTPVVPGATQIESLLNDPSLAGVMIEGGRRNEIAKRLAKRPGPILPLLSVQDEDYRFRLERVVSVDTTAAGGNAALLATV
ncbi:MAG: L-glutamate gamma-semialdehyde dehydrogenase, partial [Pseudomonadota bacterium]